MGRQWVKIRSEIRFSSEVPQVERDAIAKRAGQRSPSEKTGALVLGKLDRRKAA